MNTLPHPLFDPQSLPAALRCQKCRGELYPGETAYRLDGRWVCPDCFRAGIRDLLAWDPTALARSMGLDTVRFP